MKEPEVSGLGVVVPFLALPVAIACCAVPAFMLGLASSVVSWFSGFGTMEAMAVFSIVAAIAFAVNRFKRARTPIFDGENVHE